MQRIDMNSTSIDRRLVVAASVALLLCSACALPDLRSPTPSAAPPLTADEIAALIAAPDRSDADRRNDVRRKPAEMLGFIGVGTGMKVLDLSAGGGYTTELLARAVGPGGRAWGQSVPRNPPPARTSAMALAERAQRPAASAIVPVVQPFESPAPPGADRDAMGVDRTRMNAAVFAALKRGGAYVIADHAGRPGTGISESNTLHRIEEAFLKKEVEAAGFRLAGEGSFLRSPADPRDREEPEPPTRKDEFVLRFVKP